MPKHIPNVLDPFGQDYMSREQRAELATGLRELASWIEKSEFPIPRTTMFGSDHEVIALDIASTWMADQDFVKRPGSAIRLIGGRVDKIAAPHGGPFKLIRRFGEHVVLRYSISRDAVCTPRTEATTLVENVPLDQARAAELEAEQERISEELKALETVAITKPTTQMVYDCPPALLPEKQDPDPEPVAAASTTDDLPF